MSNNVPQDGLVGVDVGCYPYLKISPRYIQFLGVDFVHQNSRYVDTRIKRQSLMTLL